jgi:hypothetical protein
MSGEAGGGYRYPDGPNEICCDCCPYEPTCEEENDFLASIGLGDPGDFEWGDDGHPTGWLNGSE